MECATSVGRKSYKKPLNQKKKKMLHLRLRKPTNPNIILHQEDEVIGSQNI